MARQFKITTTGSLNPVPINDLGKIPGYFHPSVDIDLYLEFSIDEVLNSSDTQDAITSGFITVIDENGDSITDIEAQTAGGGTGDMNKSVYDIDGNGVVDNSENLEGSDSAYHLNTDNHTNGVTNKVFTGVEKSKLGFIENGADVTDSTNVKSAGATMNADLDLSGNNYFLDEDDMVSDDDTKLASQQSIKAYVDSSTSSVAVKFNGFNESRIIPISNNVTDADMTPDFSTIKSATISVTNNTNRLINAPSNPFISIGDTVSITFISNVLGGGGNITFNSVYKKSDGTDLDTITANGQIIELTKYFKYVRDGALTFRYEEIGGEISTSTNLSIGNLTPSSLDIQADNGTDATIPSSTTLLAGLMSSSDKSKLDGIELNATSDQTSSEIKSSYESNANTNAFTDSEKSKLSSLESSKFLGEFISLSALQLANPSPSFGSYANVDSGIGSDVERYVWDDSDSSYVLQLGVSTSLTDSQIKVQYENNADTNAFTDSEKSKLLGIESNAKDDQVASEVPSTPSGNLISTNVQSALNELQSEIDPLTSSSHTHTNKVQLDLITDGNHDVRLDNPHVVTKLQVGLSNVPDVDATSRSNHTGTQLSSTISDLSSSVRSTLLTGISFASTLVVTATDTILSSIGKLQAQVSLNNSKVSADGSVSTHSDVDLTSIAPLDNLEWNGSSFVRFFNNKHNIVLSGTTLQDINTVAATPISWNNQINIDTNDFTHTSGTSTINIVNTGVYRFRYLVNSSISGGQRRNVTMIVRINGLLQVITGSAMYVRNLANPFGSNLSLPMSPPIAINAGDTVDLASIRVGEAGIVNTVANGYWFEIIRVS